MRWPSSVSSATSVTRPRRHRRRLRRADDRGVAATWRRRAVAHAGGLPAYQGRAAACRQTTRRERRHQRGMQRQPIMSTGASRSGCNRAVSCGHGKTRIIRLVRVRSAGALSCCDLTRQTAHVAHCCAWATPDSMPSTLSKDATRARFRPSALSPMRSAIGRSERRSRAGGLHGIAARRQHQPRLGLRAAPDDTAGVVAHLPGNIASPRAPCASASFSVARAACSSKASCVVRPACSSTSRVALAFWPPTCASTR